MHKQVICKNVKSLPPNSTQYSNKIFIPTPATTQFSPCLKLMHVCVCVLSLLSMILPIPNNATSCALPNQVGIPALGSWNWPVIFLLLNLNFKF